MSDQPKVSERLMKLLTAYVSAAEYTEASEGLGARETKTARRNLLSAIAEIEQRAEKAGASAETIEVLADVIRKHHADIVIADAKGEPKADDDTWVVCAINELGKQRERAEKWKEAAVAFHNANLAHADLELWITVPENIKNQPESFGEAVERAYVANCAVGRSIAALGDEWDEATR